MLWLNNNKYKLALLDTNALSDLLMSTQSWLKYVDKKFGLDKTMLGCSIFTLSELCYSKPLFNKYLELFSVFPSVIFDGYDSIFRKEIANYDKKPVEINPIVIAPCALNDNTIKVPKERLEKVLSAAGFLIKTNEWRMKRREILNGILSLRKNYPAKGNGYTKEQIEEFVFLVTMDQIFFRDAKFAEDHINKQRNSIDIKKFPSVISSSYVVFYKFYPDNRTPILSDVFDIMISSLFPYVEIVITEKHLCEIIRKVKNSHGFFPNLEYYSLSELKNEIRNA